MNMNNEEDIYREILATGREEMSWPGFEDEVMTKVEKLESGKELVREGYRRGVAFSWIFFVVGIICGVVLTYLFPRFDIWVPGVDSGLFLLFFQVGFMLFILFHFEKLMNMTRGTFFQPQKGG